MVSDYRRDGVAVLRGALDPDYLVALELALEQATKAPTAMSRNLAENGSVFFNDFNTWRKNLWIGWLARELAPACAAATGNRSLRLFHDHVIVKSGDSPETPWHQDSPYYCVAGPNNFTIWMSPDDVPLEEGLRFFPGSHNSGKSYVPVNFKDGTPMSDDMEVLDAQKMMNDGMNWIGWELERGDALIFDNRIIHRAVRSKNPVPRSSLSIRYLGENATLTTNFVNDTPPYSRMGLVIEEGAEPPENWFPRLYP